MQIDEKENEQETSAYSGVYKYKNMKKTVLNNRTTRPTKVHTTGASSHVQESFTNSNYNSEGYGLSCIYSSIESK